MFSTIIRGDRPDSDPIDLKVFLGGTFDPIHLAHIQVAVDLIEQLQLDSIQLMPNGNPAHRNQPLVSTQHRLAMCQLAIEGYEKLQLNTYELSVGSAPIDKPCYTVETLEFLQQQYPDSALCWVIGTDGLNNLQSWYRWQDLLKLAHLIVLTRPKHELNPKAQDLLTEHGCQNPKALTQQQNGLIYPTTVSELAISSSQIREKLAKKASVSHLLAEKVIHYIEQHKLYQTT